MKHIKKFENLNDSGYYWKVNTKHKFKIALDKIGVPNHDIKTFSNITSKKYIYIFNDEGEWTWANLGSDSTYWKNVYMGEVIVTDDDIEKWKAKKVAKKYNL